MTRNQFLKISWSKYVRPVILGVLVIYAINFLIDAMQSEGSERNFLFLILTLSLIVVAVLLIRLLSTLLSDRLKSIMPESVLIALKNTDKVLSILSPFVGLWLIYEMYITSDYIGMAITIWFVAQELKRDKKTTEQK